MDKRIKVGFMLTPVEFGGLERVCLNLLKNINRQRFDVFPILLTRPWEPDNLFGRELKNEKYDYCEIPVALREEGDFIRVARCYKLAFKIIKEQNFDLLHTHGYFADIVGIPLARLLKIPSLSTCHGFITNTWKYRLYNMIDRFILKFCNSIIAVSEGLKEQLLSSGIEKGRIQVINNAINSSQSYKDRVRKQQKSDLGIDPDEFILGYVGRLSIEKGIHHLLTALSQLSQKGLSLKAIIVGDGPQKRELMDQVQQLNITDKVIFTGFQKDIYKWLFCMDIFILPSLTEGLPMALLEAMSCGVPVIATEVGGVPQIIKKGINGILVTPGKPEDLTYAVLEIYADETIRSKLAENAYDLIKREYGIKKWINKIEGEYLNLHRWNKSI